MMARIQATALTLLSLVAASSGLAKPSAVQMAYTELEIGAMITWNLQTICVEDQHDPRASTQRCQKLGWVPTVETAMNWTPNQLDTDKWVEVAMSFGAKHIVLVADHMTGFALWNTSVHDFSLPAGKFGRDVVAELSASCKKYGIKFGLFYSTHYNWYLGVNNYKVGWPPLSGKNVTQEQFDQIASLQVQELLTQYGEIDQIWFDGGPDVTLTPTIPKIVEKYAPNAICHSCIPFERNVGTRWMGNEEGVMPIPSWGASTGNTTGDPHSPTYLPPETDTVLREHYWFWWNNTEQYTKSPSRMLSNYITSVGRSSNLILNMAPDSTGAIPESDVVAYKKLGDGIRCIFSKPAGHLIAPTGTQQGSNTTFQFSAISSLPESGSRNITLVMKEDVSNGQKIDSWSLTRSSQVMTSSVSIGRNRLINLVISDTKQPPFKNGDILVLTVSSFEPNPTITSIQAFNWEGCESC
eukprot:TRINITY_DN18350_c0_g1_i1.p1 TRINITY_DN18350_c0_g1~~TRINITY_DN18350_c0_g1_i1.p1  ORF type:complete len:467 (+),score=70.25 TRINITY_DN18350_c0_g1_i1:79-1479(+)